MACVTPSLALGSAKPCVQLAMGVWGRRDEVSWGVRGRIVVMSSVGDFVVRQGQRGPWQRPTNLAFGAEVSVLVDCGVSRRHCSQHNGAHPAYPQ